MAMVATMQDVPRKRESHTHAHLKKRSKSHDQDKSEGGAQELCGERRLNTTGNPKTWD